MILRDMRVRGLRHTSLEADCFRRTLSLRPSTRTGGARRDRTDDLMLAKHALSQLSYGPENSGGLPCVAGFASEAWWARDELNVRPHAYQACALTT